MINGINHITFGVSDLQASLKFYVDLLQLQLIAKWDEGAYLKAGDQWIALNVDNLDLSPNSQNASHIAFNVNEEDFEAMKSRLENHGVKKYKENTSEGPSYYFLDPDGHCLEIHYSTLENRIQWAKEKMKTNFITY